MVTARDTASGSVISRWWRTEIARYRYRNFPQQTARKYRGRCGVCKWQHGYATWARLVLAQFGVPEKTNEITAIPDVRKSAGWDPNYLHEILQLK